MPPESEVIRSLIDDPMFRQKVRLMARRVLHEMNLPESSDEDLSQTALNKFLHLSNEQVKTIKNLDAYLSVIVRNEACNLHRKTKANLQVPIEEDAVGRTYSDNFEEAQHIESGLLLREICESLNEEDYSLLQLMIIGYTEKEIGYRLTISHDSARQRVSRLRKKLRELLFTK